MLLLVSCDNFLKANDVASEIKEHIDYANAPSSSVLLKSDASIGTFIAGDSKEFKIGYDTEIYFSANIENGILDHLIAQSATDASKDMSEYVKIEIVERDDEKGFYKIIVKVLKQAPDIIIKPVCIPFPAVQSYTPKSDSDSFYANTGITVTFNMPMEAENLSAAQSVFNYKNIFITHNGTDVSEYFEAPKFNSEKTTLTLLPKKTFVDYIKSTNEVSIKVNVFFSDSISLKNDDRKLYLKQDANSNFYVNYKPEAETNPPLTNGFGFFASNNEYALEELNNKSKADVSNLEIFTQDQITVKGNTPQTEYEQKIFQNRTDGNLYIYGRYIDQDSGVNKITITNLHTNDKGGVSLREEEITKDYYVDKEYPDVCFSKQGQNVLFRIKYELPESAENPADDEGAYDFSVQVFDACDNASAVQTFTVIKAVQLDISGINVYNVFNNLDIDGTDEYEIRRKVCEYYNNDTYNDIIKTIKFIFANPVYSVVESLVDVDFTIKYTDKSGKEVEAPVPASQDNKKYFEYALDVDHAYDQSFTLTAKNKYGKIQSRTFYIPPRPQKAPGTQYIIIPENANITDLYETRLTEQNKLDPPTIEGYNYGYHISIVPKCNDIYFSNFSSSEAINGSLYYFSNGLLFSECCADPIMPKSDILNLFEEDTTISVPPKIKNIEHGVDGEQFTQTITLDDNVWDNSNDWDFIVVFEGDFLEIPRMVFTKGTLTGTRIIKYISASTTNYKLAGIKGEKRSTYSQNYNSTLSTETKENLENEKRSIMIPNLDNGIILGAKFGPGSGIGFNKINEYFMLVNAEGLIDTYQITVNNSSRYIFNKNIVSTAKGAVIADKGWGNEYLPMLDWSYGSNIIDVTVSNKNGSYSKTVVLQIDKSPIIFKTPETQDLPMNRLNLESKPTTYDIDHAYFDGYEYGSYIYVSYLDNQGWQDFGQTNIVESTYEEKLGYLEKGGSEGAYTYTILTNEDFYTAHGDLPSNTFIKVNTVIAHGDKQADLLFFNGKPSSGDKTDKLLDKGDYFLVSSDQPVYVNTVATRKTYSECCNWTSEEWEELRFKANEQLLSFGNANSGLLGLYIPDTDWM